MNANTLHRTLLASVIGSALAFGISAPSIAHAQDAGASNQAQAQGQGQDQDDADKAEQRRARQAARAAEHAQDKADSQAQARSDAGAAQARAEQRRQQDVRDQSAQDAARNWQAQREAQQAQAAQQQAREQSRQRDDAQADLQQRETQRQMQQAQVEREQRQDGDNARRAQEQFAQQQDAQQRAARQQAAQQQAAQQQAAQQQAWMATDEAARRSRETRQPRGAGDVGQREQAGESRRDQAYRGDDAAFGAAQARQGGYGNEQGRTEDRGYRGGQRPSRSQQDALIAQQRQQARQYDRDLASRESLARQQSLLLQRSNRRSQYAYQQRYYDLLRQQRQRNDWQSYNYYSDPYFSSAPSYRYYRGGNYYAVNQYAARLLRQAVDYGYREGIRAGRADEQDGWRFDYRNSFAYQDANYGYRGMYVRQSEYNYYFREGFRRGYEDGFYGRRRYGHYSNGNDSILSTVLSLVLNLQPYNGGYGQGYYNNGY